MGEAGQGLRATDSLSTNERNNMTALFGQYWVTTEWSK